MQALCIAVWQGVATLAQQRRDFKISRTIGKISEATYSHVATKKRLKTCSVEVCLLETEKLSIKKGGHSKDDTNNN